MSAYVHAMELCRLRAWSSHAPRPDPATPRVEYVVERLAKAGLTAALDVFPAMHRRSGKYVNASVRFSAVHQGAPLVVVCAHHDVSNADSDNCQDNTASVAHVLALAELFAARPPEHHDVLLAFLDAEEIVDPVNSGAGKLCRYLRDGKRPAAILNLELTANGRNLWFECGYRDISPAGRRLVGGLPRIYRAFTPYNDAVAFRHHGFDGLCIGTLDDANLTELRATGSCDTWALCHRSDDSFDRSAREDDMVHFTGVAEQLLRSSFISGN